MRGGSLALLGVTLCVPLWTSCVDDAAVLLGPAQPVLLQLTDVSPVWPLPDAPLSSAEELDDLGWIRAAPAGREPHLPRDLVDRLPRLTRTDELDDLYASLTVVAARLDPCFSEGAGESATPCQPQLRVVLQPIRPQRDDPTAPPEARDAALHAFYAGDEHEIVDAARALQGLRIERGVSAYGPLDVSPLLTDAEGRAAVRRVLRPLMTANRLRRVTATTVHANDTAWTFVGLDRDGHGHDAAAEDDAAGDGHAHDEGTVPLASAWFDIDVPTLGSHDQHVISDGGTAGMRALLTPAPTVEDDLSVLLDDATAAAASRQARQAAYDAAARIENPLLHNPGTVDCGSCHLAAVVRVAGRVHAGLGDSPDAFSSTRFDLTASPAFSDTRIVRAFGYRFRTLAIAPRVVHESALTVEAIERALTTESGAHAAAHAHDDAH